jgi:hypothetical protein
MNLELVKMAMHNLNSLALDEIEKMAFEPMPGGQQAPVDPAQAQAVDPSQAPVDPSMAAGGSPAAGLPPPAAAPAAPAASSQPPQGVYDMIVGAVRQVAQEGGFGGSGGGNAGGAGAGAGAGAGGKGGKDVESRIGAIEGALAQVLEHMGLASPKQAINDALMQAAGPAGDGFSSGSGSPDAGAGAMAMPAMGPMDPNASAAMANIKAGSVSAPLDNITLTGMLLNAVNKRAGR